MIPIGSVLFLLFASVGVGGLLLLGTARRDFRENLSGLPLAAFFFLGLAVSVFPLQEAVSRRGLILGMYIASMVVGFAAALLYVRDPERRGLPLWLFLAGAAGLAALVGQALGTVRIHSVNLGPMRLALDLGVSAFFMGGLFTMAYLFWADCVPSAFFHRANRWVLISALIKAVLTVRYLTEWAGSGFFVQEAGVLRWPLLWAGLREIGLVAVLIGGSILWYSARSPAARIPAPVLLGTLMAGLLMELAGKILLVQWRVIV